MSFDMDIDLEELVNNPTSVQSAVIRNELAFVAHPLHRYRNLGLGNSDLSDQLKKYVEIEIIPKYDSFDKGHSSDHVVSVIDFSLKLAKELIKGGQKINLNMVYVAAAYHDLGMFEGKKDHHVRSAIILREDNKLCQWFNEVEIEMISHAIQDHRASLKRCPRSIYGKILSDADKSDILDIGLIFKRFWNGMVFDKYCYGKDDEEVFNIVYSYMVNKYGKDGYVNFYLVETLKLLGSNKVDEVRSLISSSVGKEIIKGYYQYYKDRGELEENTNVERDRELVLRCYKYIIESITGVANIDSKEVSDRIFYLLVGYIDFAKEEGLSLKSCSILRNSIVSFKKRGWVQPLYDLKDIFNLDI